MISVAAVYFCIFFKREQCEYSTLFTLFLLHIKQLEAYLINIWNDMKQKNINSKTENYEIKFGQRQFLF